MQDKVAANAEAIKANADAIAALTTGDGKAKAAETADKLATAVKCFSYR